VTDPVLAALVGVGGAVLVAVVTVIAQVVTTKSVIRSEREKVRLRIAGEEAARLREKRTDRIIDAVSELLEVSDPDGRAPNHAKAAALIMRVQLLLDATSQHSGLREALNNLGLRLSDYLEEEPENRLHEKGRLLKAQSAVIERTQEVLRRE
jgi:hypothetical protein